MNGSAEMSKNIINNAKTASNAIADDPRMSGAMMKITNSAVAAMTPHTTARNTSKETSSAAEAASSVQTSIAAAANRTSRVVDKMQANKAATVPCSRGPTTILCKVAMLLQFCVLCDGGAPSGITRRTLYLSLGFSVEASWLGVQIVNCLF